MPASKRGIVSDLNKVNAMTDTDIDYSDIPELSDAWFEMANVNQPGEKELVSIRLDGDVLGWFRQQGRGYQTRINHVLRTYVAHQVANRQQPGAAVLRRAPGRGDRSALRGGSGKSASGVVYHKATSASARAKKRSK